MSNFFTSGQRLLAMRLKLGLSQQKLSEITGVSRSYINDVEAGRSKPSANMLSKITSKTDVNIDWLITGQGEMFRAATGPKAGAPPDDGRGLDRRLAALRGVLDALTEEDRDAILNDAFARAQTAQQIADLKLSVAALKPKTRS